jgi:hypothetical protein
MDMSMDRARSFLLMTYHDLPNVLLVGSLFFGILSGYLPLTWVGLGMMMNWLMLYLMQMVMGIIFDKGSDRLAYRDPSLNCTYGYKVWQSLNKPSFGGEERTVVAPSFWMGSAFFFSIFCIYNSFRVMFAPQTPNAVEKMVDNRKAYTISTVIIGFVFLCLIFLRGMTGCETWFGIATAFFASGGLAIGFWHLLSLCGGGRIPDILQVIGSMAPDVTNNKVPVVCSAEGFQGSEDDTAETACQKYKGLVQEFLAFAEEFSEKSPEDALNRAAFQKKNTEMAAKFAGFKKAYAGKLGLGSKPNETCLLRSPQLYNQFLDAQQRVQDAGWKLGV